MRGGPGAGESRAGPVSSGGTASGAWFSAPPAPPGPRRQLVLRPAVLVSARCAPQLLLSTVDATVSYRRARLSAGTAFPGTLCRTPPTCHWPGLCRVPISSQSPRCVSQGLPWMGARLPLAQWGGGGGVGTSRSGGGWLVDAGAAPVRWCEVRESGAWSRLSALFGSLLSFVTEIQFVTLTGGDVWSHWVQLGWPPCLAPSSECRSVAASAEEACVYESPSRQGCLCPRSSPCSLWLVMSFKETNARCISYKDFT